MKPSHIKTSQMYFQWKVSSTYIIPTKPAPFCKLETRRSLKQAAAYVFTYIYLADMPVVCRWKIYIHTYYFFSAQLSNLNHKTWQDDETLCGAVRVSICGEEGEKSDTHKSVKPILAMKFAYSPFCFDVATRLSETQRNL